MRTTTIMAAVATGAVLSLSPAWAGGGGGGGYDCALESEGAAIEMYDDCFQGRVHRVRAGARLVVTNMGGYEHTLTAGDGSFDTGTVEAGASQVIRVDTPGVYPVLCAIHGWYMGGTLVVEDAGSSQMSPAADTPPWLEPEAGFATAGLLIGAVGQRWWLRRGRAR